MSRHRFTPGVVPTGHCPVVVVPGRAAHRAPRPGIATTYLLGAVAVLLSLCSLVLYLSSASDTTASLPGPVTPPAATTSETSNAAEQTEPPPTAEVTAPSATVPASPPDPGAAPPPAAPPPCEEGPG